MSLDRLSVSLAFEPGVRIPVGTLTQSGRDLAIRPPVLPPLPKGTAP